MKHRRPTVRPRTRAGTLAAAAFVVAAGLALIPSAKAQDGALSAGDVAAAGGAFDAISPSAGVLDTPRVLAAADAERYRRIFALQADAKWRAADREIVQLDDRVLMGHVLFQRYMHPTGYRSKYVELKTWLDAYADHPGAYRVYRLALKRQPNGYKSPRRPRLPKSSYAYAYMRAVAVYRTDRKRSRATWREVRRVQRQVRNNLRHDRITVSEKYLRRPSVQRLLDTVEQDELWAKIAAAWFYYGESGRAYDLASAAAERSRANLSHADWIAGLAAWRMGEHETARRHFEALAYSPVASPWNSAAGAFWAARAYLVTGQPAAVNGLLRHAAAHPRTFYGLISARQLGIELDFDWSPPPLQPAGYAELLEIPAVQRAAALVQAEAYRQAEQELRLVYLTADASVGQPLLALAHRLELPAMQLRLARGIRGDNDRPFDQALFPLPPWQPSTGFEVDQALMFAFMRQESGFNTRAKSSVGARGLMQLMPRTASFVANDRSLRRNTSRLYDPEFNLELGQQYLSHLLGHELVNGDLFKLTIAYNAGPGNLSRWLKRIQYEGDPLMFIESIPARETRMFVERVLTNLWIYRERLNQDTPSLDAVATGHIPIYLDLDRPSLRLVENDQR